ncbi:hypothetical protein KR054_006965 [Drosophila jambulina]|nr:hypothetical protein KR054_006965 [Drosophila jambulina]
MTGHGSGSSKREGASRVQLQLNPEVQVLANLGEEPLPVSNSSCSSSSSSSNLGEADSEGDAEVDSHSEPGAVLTMDIAGARFMYSPLDGGSDSDSELDLDDVELFCEEALALLAHEIVCCDCDSDKESEEDGEGESESESEMESGSDQIDGYGQDNLSHSTYQLMFSEEDEEELVDNAKKIECPYVVESVLLLEEEQESEKSDPKSGDSLGNAAPERL